MRAPAFWWRDRPSLAAVLLQPIGSLYGAATARRMGRAGATLPVPVLCVGNLVAGGAGKTPTALLVGAMLAGEGRRPAFLSRGYGRRTPARDAPQVIRVDPGVHDATQVGDEPLLLAATAPTYVSADRVAAGRQAIADGADVLVLDDGLQNPALVKTATVAVVDGRTGIGNGLCVPAGPLRAPLAAQWPHVSAVLVIGDGAAGDAVARTAVAQGRAVLRGRLIPDAAALATLADRPLYAFAGIGRPEKFFATLCASGLTLAGQRAFPDHHGYTARDRQALLAAAEASEATLVTTAKDRVRLPADFPARVLPVTLALEDPAALRRWAEAAV